MDFCPLGQIKKIRSIWLIRVRPFFPNCWILRLWWDSHSKIMCYITWITINAHKFIINLFSIIFYDNSLQAKRHKCRARGQFMAIHVQRNIWIRCWIRLDLCHPMTKMSYFGLSVNASCLRYFKIISCWPRTAKSTEGCNYLIISSRF